MPKRLGLGLLVILILFIPILVSAPYQNYLEPEGLPIIQGNFVRAMSSPLHLGEAIQVLGTVTAYSKEETCKNRDCITASGKPADFDIIACPREIPLGTLVEIEGRIYECGDRTDPKYDGRFDLWWGEDYSGAKEFGKQYLIVKIYK